MLGCTHHEIRLLPVTDAKQVEWIAEQKGNFGSAMGYRSAAHPHHSAQNRYDKRG